MNRKMEKAALLVSEDRLNDDQIAVSVGIGRTCLWKWKQSPEFQERVRELQEEFRSRQTKRGLAQRERRLAEKMARHKELCAIVVARGKDPMCALVPGGKSGLLKICTRVVTINGAHRVVVEDVLDRQLLRELSYLEQEIAHELGQDVDFIDISVSDSEAKPPIKFGIELDRELERIQRLLDEAAQKRHVATAHTCQNGLPNPESPISGGRAEKRPASTPI